MILGPNQILQAVLAGSASTTEPTFVVESNGVTSYGIMTDTTPVTLLAGTPGGSPLDELWLFNPDTANAMFTVSLVDLGAGVSTTLFTTTLASNQSTYYSHGFIATGIK
jgi:hypothetical protein